MPPAPSSATETRNDPPVSTPHAVSLEKVVQVLHADVRKGLSSQEAAARLEKYGRNQLQEAPTDPAWKRLLAQFSDLVIWILIVAAVISGLLGEWIDAGAILAIVVLNGLLGFFQEQRAEKALAALQSLSSPHAKVIRDGVLTDVAAADVVPGDLVDIDAGDRIPADIRLVESFSLTVQEAALTGESVPVEKNAKEAVPAEASIGDRHNMTYQGTAAAAGKAKGIVVATGMQTELGHIARMLQATEREATPLQKQLAELGRILVVICLILVAVVFVLQFWQESDLRQLLREGRLFELIKDPHMLEVFLVAVSLAVAAVPEGLPAVVTLALALGLQRMVKRNALVRKLASVETLGAVSVICSDKTGTLTRNEMTVRELTTDRVRYLVTGGGYRPEGEFRTAALDESSSQEAAENNLPLENAGSPSTAAVSPSDDPHLVQLLEIAVWCNNSRLVDPAGRVTEPAPISDSDVTPPAGPVSRVDLAAQERAKSAGDVWTVIGDPTEGALLVVGKKAGIESHEDDGTRSHENPFDSDRKTMSVVVEHADGRNRLYAKGAPEAVLGLCTQELRDGNPIDLTDKRREEILSINRAMAGRALRVLAFGYRDLRNGSEVTDESDLVFVGLCGMIDPPREEVKSAVAVCRNAGIRPVMITGDHPATAQAIALELGLVTGDERVLTGQEFDKLDDDQLVEQVEQISVYARVSAEHKLRVVKAWRKRGRVVAMTGDGVNDAPAVKQADIGIAMGITGTDVTKEASSMVLMDDNFATIVSAVEEGRSIYDNIRNVLQFLLSCNAGEILVMLIASIIGWPAPLLPIHLLWINLVTDSLPALALSLEKPGPGIMDRKPRPSDAPMLSWPLASLVIAQGALIAMNVLLTYWIFRRSEPDNLARAQSAAFCMLVFSELFRSLACRNMRLTLFQLGLFGNKALLGAIGLAATLQVLIMLSPAGVREIFKVWEHTPTEWLIILGMALVDITLIEIGKLVAKPFLKNAEVA
ncbi:MAG: cation-translocating P-type ATPase [Planctomycetaceae bacterium]|nr:cation-translocating P-type ATPase [Planctomycetaceae bacterium]